MLSLVPAVTGFAPGAPALAPVMAPAASVSMQERSASIPFLKKPPALDGSLPGDVGFDPYCMVALAPTKTAADSGPWADADRKTRMLMSESEPPCTTILPPFRTACAPSAAVLHRLRARRASCISAAHQILFFFLACGGARTQAAL